MAIVDVVNRPASGGVWPASCLMLTALCISTLPAVAGPLDALERPRYEIARPESVPVRAHHKTKRNDIQIGKQTVPAGPLHVIVSIASQRVALFSNGIRIAEAPISTGVAGHPTPASAPAVDPPALPQRCPSPAAAETTSPRSLRSPRRSMPPRGSFGQQQPP